MPIERAHNLPAPRDRLIGRAREIEAVRELLLGGTHRLVTLTGMGGAGKTRLALEVVWTLRERFPGGVWLVELAGVADDASLPETVASALGLLQVPDSSPTEALIAFLRTRSPLLVLDNCEHLIAAVANLAEQLLDRCPGLRMLTTSREPLQIAGERQLRVGPLALPGAERFASVEEVAHAPAVELFVARARDVAPGFALSPENAPVVAAICIRVDGVPLALELAAARVRVLTVEQILARLDDSMRLLTGGSRSGLTRQQTLKATLDWSYDLLGEPERAGLRRLSVFARGGGLDAAEAVCGGGEIAPEDLLEVLTRLVDKSLLVVDGTGVAARYRLLEPVRQYAAQQLDEAGERARVKSAHARFYHALATRAALFLHGPDQIAWLDQLEAEHDNLRAALQWSLAEGDPVLGLHLAVALSPFWEARGRLSEGRRWLEALLAAPDAEGLPAELRTRALLAVGRLAQWLADPDAAAPLEAALALARQRGDQAVVVEALAYLGAVRRHAGAQEDSARLLEESLTLARAAGDEAGIALALLTFGVTMRFQGNYAPSVPLLVEGLERFQQLGDLRWIATTQTMLGASLVKLGEMDRATNALLAGLAGHQTVGDLTFSVFGLLSLATALAAWSQPELAARVLGALLGFSDRAGTPLAPRTQREFDEIAARTGVVLGAAEFDRTLAQGRDLTLEQVIAMARSVLSTPADDAAAPDPDALTRRQLEVARLVARGLSDRQIADELSISVATVGVHVHQLLKKLDLRSRWQVAAALAERKLLDPSR